jgi:hypothetical protein
VSITIGFQLWQNLWRHWEGAGGERKVLKHREKAKEVSLSEQNDHFSKVVNLGNWLCVHAGAGPFYTFYDIRFDFFSFLAAQSGHGRQSQVELGWPSFLAFD